MPFKETCPCMGPPKSSTNFGVVRFFSPATFIIPSCFVRPEKPVSSSRPTSSQTRRAQAGSRLAAISGRLKGLALTVSSTPPHSACTGCHDFFATISCLMICCLPFYSPQLLSSD
jgi:hypothetical protein